MAVVKLKFDWQVPAWVTGNTDVYEDKVVIYLTDGSFAKCDGVTQVQNLTFWSPGGGGGTWGTITGTLSDQTDLQTELDAKADLQSTLLTGGIISVSTIDGTGTNNDIRVTASTFFILGQGSYSAIQTDFLNITLSSAGTQRYIGLYGTTSNTISKVEGSEAALATFPSQPANTALIGYVLVSDASVTTTPDLSGYLLRADKATAADVALGTNDTKYVTALALAGKIVPVQITTHGVSSPADNTLYYFGVAIDTLGMGTVIDQRARYPKITGTIIAAAIEYFTTTAASTELSTINLRINSTDHVITNAFNVGAGTQFLVNSQLINGLNIAVTDVDKWQGKWLSPTWVTNPANFYMGITFYVRQ